VADPRTDDFDWEGYLEQRGGAWGRPSPTSCPPPRRT
jgi:hypothetical protein